MQGERLKDSSSFKKIAEMKPSKEEVRNLYDGYKDLLDKHNKEIKATGLRKLLTLGGWDKFSTKIESENIDLVVSRVKSKKSNKHLVIDIGEKTNLDESIRLQLSKNGTASLIHPGCSLLDEALSKVLGRESPTKKGLSRYVEALDFAEKKLAESPQNNSNQV